jgi:hypothetical protein
MRAELCFLGDVYLPEPASVKIPDLDRYVFNLEYPITRNTVGTDGKVNLKAESNHLPQTFPKFPMAVCVANNHILDYGEEGFRDTLEEMQKSGIPYFGAGQEDDRYHNPLIIEVDGVTVGLAGYACPSTSAVLGGNGRSGASAIDIGRIRRDMETARERGAQVVIVSVHWGAEQVYLPKPSDVETARRIVDAGADMIIGHHAHCIQPYEIYNDKPIFYGLGNCIFPDLDVPSYYRDGVPTERFVARQFRWNRTSLCVRYNVADRSFKVSRIVYADNKVTAVPSDCDRYLIRIKDLERYATTFKKSFFYGKLRTAAMNYITKPKLPRARHIRTMWALSKEKNYK